MPVVKRFTVIDLEATQRKQRNAESKVEVLLEQFTDTVNKSNELLASAQMQNIKNAVDTKNTVDNEVVDSGTTDKKSKSN